MNSLKSHQLSFIFFIAFLISPNILYAFGDLTVSPTRVIFEGRDRSESITLVNRSSQTKTYRIEFSQMSMNETGGFTEITEPEEGQYFASDFIRYSPRQVEIKPGESQTIRLIVKKPSGLPEEEYRSHLVMYALPENSEESQAIESLQNKDDSEDVSIQLSAIYRVAIPVILRQGDLAVDFSIGDVVLKKADEKQKLTFTMHRNGKRSKYANLDVIYKPKNDPTREMVVGQVSEYAVYVPNKKRTTSVDLRLPEGINQLSGELELRYYSGEGKSLEVLATKTIKI